MRGGRVGRRQRRYQLDAADIGAPQQALEQLQPLCIEVRRVLRKRHRQHGLDTHAQIQGDLGDQQVGALGHADYEPQFSVRQVLLELVHEGRHRGAQARHVVQIQVAMT
jgi:hypothetical protein